MLEALIMIILWLIGHSISWDFSSCLILCSWKSLSFIIYPSGSHFPMEWSSSGCSFSVINLFSVESILTSGLPHSLKISFSIDRFMCLYVLISVRLSFSLNLQSNFYSPRFVTGFFLFSTQKSSSPSLLFTLAT